MTLFPLFELCKTLSVGYSRDDITEVILSTYGEYGNRGILALVCNNGYLLLRQTSSITSKAVIKQIPWFKQSEKAIKALCFDSSASWLLVVCADSSLYILPVFSYLGPAIKPSCLWRTDDLTEIKLQGQRGVPTSLCWWQTMCEKQIGIMGNEVGEISFINLKTRREIGGTYINTSVQSLHVLYNEKSSTSYLLISGTRKKHWKLLLEEKKLGFLWPGDSEIETKKEPLNEKRTVFGGERSSDEKQLDPRPQHLSQYDDRVFLTPQHARGRQLLTVRNPSSNILQVYESYFESPLLSSYRLPSDCGNIILTDKLLFLTLPDNLGENKPRHKLKILSCQLSEVSGEGAKKREAYEAEVQTFSFPGEIISCHKKSSSVMCTDSLVEQLSDLSCHYDFPDDVTVKFATVTKSGKGIPRPSNINLKKNSHRIHKIENESGLKKDRERLAVVGKRKHSTLEKCFILENLISGFYIVTKHCVFECRPRVTPEKLFLSLTASPADLPRAEHLGVMLSLDINYLYEVAADLQLANGQFAQAVRLYQLSKCPQLKRVANFISYGYLSELLAYVQVLFTTTITEVQAPDRVHFGNLAVHCFVQQILEKTGEKLAVVHAFRDFLRDNIYYNEDVAVRLLAEQHLYKHLHYCAKVRGQQTKMLQHLLNHEEHCLKVEEETRALLVSKGLADEILHGINDDYIQCITSPDLLQHLVSKPQLMRSHLEHLAQFLARLRADQLCEIASLYDPSQPAARLAFRKILSSPQSQSFLSCSVSSLSSTSSEILDFVQGDEGTVTEEDMIKFFIFVLLLLNHKRGSRKFDMKLLQSDFRCPEEDGADSTDIKLRPEILVPKEEPLACGLAHAGYIRDGSLFMWGKSTLGRTGHGEEEDVCLPQQVKHFETLRVKVLAVACGAYHTIALTDTGVFSWGSSRYGQLGLGELKQTTSPLLVESLAGEKIAAVACGQYHSLALTTDGRMYSWGWGVHGQLGLGNPEDQDHPILVKSLLDKQVIAVAAGQGHTAILTKLGKVYTFGCGMFGQIGQGTLSKHCWPQHVDLPETVHMLSSGYFHVIAVTTTNKLYMWGCNPQVLRLQAQSSRRARQHSGANRPPEISSSPVIPMGSSKQPLSSSRPTELSQVHLLPRHIDTSVVHGQIKLVACGSHHSVLLSTDGEVYSWGRNMEGQLGHGSRKEQKTPSMVLSLNDKKMISICCGSDFTLALDNRNKLWGWGQNDSGQLGHKSSVEGFVRPTLTTSTSASSGRVITIRTNRRMITITQGNRQGELRPVEITTIPEPAMDAHMDIDSFDISRTMPHIIHYYNSRIENFLSLPQLSKLDSPPYGPYALHATLKSFLHCCDVTTILNHCICFGDHQAAAKVYMLEGLYAQALEHQLKALSMEKRSSEEMLEEAVKIVQFYFQSVNQESTEANQHLLEQVILMWLEWKFPVESLESLLHDQLSVLCYPLGLLLFCGSVNEGKSQKICTDFLSCLSPKFCLTVADFMLQNINAGKPHEELMDKMMALTGTSDLMHQINQADTVTGWEARIPPPRLWQEVLMNLQKGVISRNSIELSPNQVELLTRSLMNEQIQRPDVPPNFPRHGGTASHQSSASSSHDVVLFTCGHHYTRHVFRTSILPGFQDIVQKLPYMLPQTMKQLMLCFESEGVIPSACPRCIVTEIKSGM